MSKKQIRQIIADLAERLSGKDFLDRSGLSKKHIQMLMNREHWEEQLPRLIPMKKRVSCRTIYEICAEPLALLGREPEDGWMKFTYQYVCHILYPDPEFTKANARFASGAEFYLAVLQYFFTMLPFGTVMYILCHYEFKVCDLWFDFDCIAGYS